MVYVRSAQLFWLRLMLGILLLPLVAGAQGKRPQLKTFEVKEPNGQILSYRYLSSSTDVAMRGTSLAPDAHIKLKVGSRPGFVELDINRGQISGLKPASQFGRDFLTYVLWAVSVDGKAANLGEITFQDNKPVSINVTTPYQTFWLMLTAEPHFAVVDPSPLVVLYSAKENPDKAPSDRTAEVIPGKLFFYTHYGDYDNKPSTVEATPNALLQARKAVELTSRAGVVPGGAVGQKTGKGDAEEQQTRDALNKAMDFLARAESAYKDTPSGSDVAQFSRTSAQIAENARALALGAVGGAHVSQLEQEVEKLRTELSKVRPETPKPAEPLSEPTSEPLVIQPEGPKPATVEARELPLSPEQLSVPEVTPTSSISKLMSQPITWVGLAGWIMAVLLLFRRRTL